MGDSLQLNGSKINHHVIRETQEKKTQERRRNVLHLMHSFLKENCLENTAESLEKEAHLLPNIEVCDNVDLDTILQEYTSYYFSKFGRYPKICKKVNSQVDIPEKKKNSKSASRPKSKLTVQEDSKKSGDDFEISVKPITNNTNVSVSDVYSLPEEIYNDLPPSLSTINLEEYPAEWKEMFQIIISEIIPRNLGIEWSDCVGMENIVDLLKEAIIYPSEYPQLYKCVSPWKGVLLYGPPGTGKTMIAKALACESGKIMINVSPSTFISKWRGESEKLVKCLFEIARKCAPCTIFIDEIDALASRRDEQQHEASRRFKSELLTQMDGILNNDEKIFILANTNLPWEVDSAILRRFEKKIFVHPPCQEARVEIFCKYLGVDKFGLDISNKDLEEFAKRTNNLSGHDIQVICKNAFMAVVRQNIKRVERTDNINNIRCIPDVPTIYGAVHDAGQFCSMATYNKKYSEYKAFYDKFGPS